MREEQDGQVVVEIRLRIVGVAEWTVPKGVRPVGEIQASCVEGCDARF